MCIDLTMLRASTLVWSVLFQQNRPLSAIPLFQDFPKSQVFSAASWNIACSICVFSWDPCRCYASQFSVCQISPTRVPEPSKGDVEPISATHFFTKAQDFVLLKIFATIYVAFLFHYLVGHLSISANCNFVILCGGYVYLKLQRTSFFSDDGLLLRRMKHLFALKREAPFTVFFY